MAGTKAGGQKTREANLAKDPNYYRNIGKLGGSGTRPETRLFYRNRELAKLAGSKGGRVSTRRKDA